MVEKYFSLMNLDLALILERDTVGLKLVAGRQYKENLASRIFIYILQLRRKRVIIFL